MRKNENIKVPNIDLKKLIIGLLQIFIITILLLRIFHFIQVLLFPYPLEYRDGATTDAVTLIRMGKNLFSFDLTPPHMYPYGIVFPIIGAFTKIVFNKVQILILLKALSFLFILSYTILIGWEIFKRTRNRLLTLLGSAIVFQSVVIAPRPETLGIFCYALCLVFASRAIEKRSWLVLLAALSVVCFYIKPYFIVCALIIMVYYFLTSKRALYWYVISLFLFLLGSFLIVNSIFPLYFVNNVIHHLNVAKKDIAYMLRQTTDYMKVYPIFFIALATGLIFWITQRVHTLKRKAWTIDIFVVAFMGILLILTFNLGLHTGTYMTYYFHLLTIPMVISSTSFIHSLSVKYQMLSQYLLIIFAIGGCLSLLNLKSLRGMNISEDLISSRNWESTLRTIEMHDPAKGYFSPPIAAVGIDRGWPVYDNGDTEYFSAGYTKSSLLNTLIPASKEVNRYNTRWQEIIDDKMRTKDFSIIAITQGYHPYIKDELLHANYILMGTEDFYIGYGNTRTTELYLPKK